MDLFYDGFYVNIISTAGDIWADQNLPFVFVAELLNVSWPLDIPYPYSLLRSLFSVKKGHPGLTCSCENNISYV